MRIKMISATVISGEFARGNRAGETWKRIVITAKNGGMFASGKSFSFGIWAEDFPWLDQALDELTPTEDGVYGPAEIAKMNPYLQHLLSNIDPINEVDPDLRSAALQWFTEIVDLDQPYYRVDENGVAKRDNDGKLIVRDKLKITYPLTYDQYGGPDHKGAWTFVNGYDLDMIVKKTLDLLYRPMNVQSVPQLLASLDAEEDNDSEEDADDAPTAE